MFKRFFLALIGAGVLLSDGAWGSEAPAYSMVLLTENYPPYNMAIDGKNFAQEDNINGIAVDVVREMFKRAGVGYSMTLRFPWERVYKLALDKPGYGVFSTVRTPEREKLFKWVGPIGEVDWVLLAPSNSMIALSGLEQAKGYQVGAYKGDAVADHLTIKGFEPLVTLRDQENARKLVNGQIDLWATADPVGRYLARLEGITGLKTVLRFQTAHLFLALNRHTPQDVVDRLQATMDQMRAEGQLDRIRDRYL
jgi:polar amino acid transport system substrate-binding protein